MNGLYDTELSGLLSPEMEAIMCACVCDVHVSKSAVSDVVLMSAAQQLKSGLCKKQR
jgi:N-acetylglutamate synthase/N-acetylornithine aminotransferase